METDVHPTRQALAVQGRSAPRKVNGKLSDVIDLMIEQGLRYVDACKQVGMSTRSIRAAFDKPHVLNELRRRKQVFRTSIGARVISRLDELAHQDVNRNAAVASCRAILQLEEEADHVAAHGSRPMAPGFIVMINAGGAEPKVVAGLGPMIDAVPVRRELGPARESD